MRRAACVLFVLVLSACPGGMRRPSSAQLAMTGTIYAGGLERRGDPLPDVTVTLLDARTGETLATNTTSETGGYRLGKSVTAGQRLVFVAAAPGFAPAVRALTVGPSTELTLSLSLEPLALLDCGESSCSAELEDAWWTSPPPQASGRLHAFDLEHERPVTVAVADGAARALALAWVELDGGEGDDGGVPEELGALALRVPPTEWSRLDDAIPDSGVLEAALAWLDPHTGAWTRLDAGVLVSESGLPLPESALPSIRRVEHSGGVVAQLPFVTRGFVGVLGPPDDFGCVEGTLDADGQPAEGALLVTLDRDGEVRPNGGFCVEAAQGQSLLAAHAMYAGLLYRLPPLPRPSAPGRCGGTCASAGTVSVAPDALVGAKLCELSGTVTDAQGTPLPMAQVVVFDESMSGSVFNTFCGKLGTRCNIATASAGDGTFQLKAPLFTRLLLSAGATVDSPAGAAGREGALLLTECPTAPVTLKLTRGVERLEVTATFSGASISWSPPRAAARLSVVDATGAAKWELISPVGFTPPVTLGQTPAGAALVTPLAGAAATGDEATVELVGTGRDGLQYTGSASATRP